MCISFCYSIKKNYILGKSNICSRKLKKRDARFTNIQIVFLVLCIFYGLSHNHLNIKNNYIILYTSIYIRCIPFKIVLLTVFVQYSKFENGVKYITLSLSPQHLKENNNKCTKETYL